MLVHQLALLVFIRAFQSGNWVDFLKMPLQWALESDFLGTHHFCQHLSRGTRALPRSLHPSKIDRIPCNEKGYCTEKQLSGHSPSGYNCSNSEPRREHSFVGVSDNLATSHLGQRRHGVILKFVSNFTNK